jgi:hypothetical protein
MKHLRLLFAAFACTTLWGCDASHIGEEERNGIVRRFAEEYYWNVAGKEGYEFISLEEIDEVLYQDNIDYRRQYIQGQLDDNQRMMAIALTKRDSFPDLIAGKDSIPYYDFKVADYQGKINRYQQVLLGIDSLAEALGDTAQQVASYTYRYTLMGKNEQGQPDTLVFYLQTNPGYGVLQFRPDTADLYPNPNDFPGYREMAGRVLGED